MAPADPRPPARRRLPLVLGVLALLAAVALAGRFIHLPGPATGGDDAAPPPPGTVAGGPSTTRDLRVLDAELDPGIGGQPAALQIPPDRMHCTYERGRTSITGTVPGFGGVLQTLQVGPFDPVSFDFGAEIDLTLDRVYRLRLGPPDARVETHRDYAASGEISGTYHEVDAAGRRVHPEHTGRAVIRWWCGTIPGTPPGRN
jgi:hypothetical protein